jgi:hypothetical protein
VTHVPDHRPLASVVTAITLPAPYFQLAMTGSRVPLRSTYMSIVARGLISVET